MTMHRSAGILGLTVVVVALGITVAGSLADASGSPERGITGESSVHSMNAPGESYSPSLLALPRITGSLLAPSPSFATTAAMQEGFECPRREISSPAEVPIHNFYFTRGRYSSGGGGFGRGGGDAWATDFNKADRQFLVVIRRILNIDAFPCENPVSLDDPALRNFPFLYILEVGRMGLTRAQAEGLRGYLLSGGFLLIDDFWGSSAWENLEWEMAQVLPEYQIVDVPLDHLIFRIVYPIEEVLQVPCTCNTSGGPAYYYENDGRVPYIRGIFDETGRLMVAIAWNSDLGDAWEWAEDPNYPWDRSNYAFQLAFNLITYAMSN